MNYCILNGKKSTLIQGLLISSLPPISKPLVRTKVEEIDGRDGDIVTKLGYSAYDKEMTIGLFGDFDIDDVIKYFDSEGTVIFSNEPDKYYKYKIINQIDFERLVRFRTAVVTFHVQPFKYSAVDDDVLFTSNELRMKRYTITNSGLTINVENNIISIKGTTLSPAQIYLPINPMRLEAGQYTVSANTNGDPKSTKIKVVGESADDSLGGTLALQEGLLEMTTNIESTDTYHNVWIGVDEGETLDIVLAVSVFNDNLYRLNVVNRGNTISRPIITIQGSGNIRLVINGSTDFKIALENDREITLDGAEWNAYQGDRLMNRQVSGDYNNLKLNAGKNDIMWEGNVTQIQFKDISRWI